MDSEESRPGSSASNSSNSSYTSQHSSPSHLQEEVDNELEGEGANVEGENVNSNNVSSPSGTRFRTKSESGSSTSSSSSSSSSASDEENDKNFTEGDEENNTVKSGGQKRSSSSEEEEESNQFQSQNDTLKSPSLKSGGNSSRRSSVSSNESLAKTDDQEDGDLNISHEDLSDISENEIEKRPASNNNILADDDDISNVSFSHQINKISTAVVEEREVVNNEFSKEEHNDDASGMPEKDTSSISKNEGNVNGLVELVVKSHDEDALDFEAEEGECAEASKEAEVTKNEQNNKEEKSDGEAEEGEELEEGEVTDEEDKRPEENEPKPVCRFYTRGQCTWGMSCRFLHPGVTDKGNYTMFENMVRSVPVAQSSVGIRGSAYGTHLPEYHDYRNERPNLHHRGGIHHSATLFPNHAESRPLVSDGPVVVENAWERGLRTAKEMMRKANKRKEQDMDFEDKKMNLTVSPDDLEKEPYYIKERERISPPEFNIYSPPDRFGRTVHGPPVLDEIDPYGRSARYRELPPHRMPHYEDERRVRPTREVIVQRVEPPGRGDEWNDPWMRSKSPGTRGGSRDHGEKRRRDHHSYSSNSSYSSSSSSQSDSSSESSQSSSPLNSRRRYNTSSNISATMARKQRSPSVQHRRGRHSPNTGFSPSKRHGIPSSPTNKRTYSPIQKRKKLSPYVNKKFYSEKNKAKRRHTTSSSASGSSSDSSGSESDTDSGSSSTDSSRSRKITQTKRSRTHDKVQHSRKHARKPEPSKKRSPISIEIKKPMTVGTSALVSPSNSLSSEKDNKKSRREELLKQLRAVEDAIAKKRSKLS